MSEKQQINGLLVNAGAPARPKFNEEIRMEAARETAEDIAEHCGREWQDVDNMAASLAKYARSYMDGYELAKELDSYARWDCNFEVCEYLDSHSHRLSTASERHQKEWAEAHGIEPAYSIGARVRVRDEAGVIDGIYEYGPAKYLILMDGETGTSRRIVSFEDAVAEEADAA